MRSHLEHIWFGQRRKTLRDFIRLVLAFYGCIAVLSAYQFVQLYLDGVLPTLWNSSFFTLLLHHSGFTALVSLFLAFIFHILEKRKKMLGFTFAAGVFLTLLILEGLLIEYYVRYYEILGVDFIQKLSQHTSPVKVLLCLLLLIPATTAMMYLFYKINSASYRILSKMYPFTIVLFSWFLATLISDKNPVNENKTQYLAASFVKKYIDSDSYETAVEYPLLRPFKPDKTLADRFDFKEKKPNIVVIVVDGLESVYLEAGSPVKDIMPYFNSLSAQSLVWDNHHSNATGHASLSVILGSLPLAEKNIIDSERYVYRNTLFSILAGNGYHTSFYFGGNSALGGIDKLLTQERIDDLVDNKDFGVNFTQQDKDAAGISLGYPDKELFRLWNARYTDLQDPQIQVIYTLSTRAPYLIPDRRSYRSKVNKILDEADLDWGSRRNFRRDRDLLASMAYADDALKSFFQQYHNRNKAEFDNTLFVITGNRASDGGPANDPGIETRVPLMLFSPMLNKPETFHHPVSHADLAPGLLQLLHTAFRIKMPTHVAWTGSQLTPQEQGIGRAIPIYNAAGVISELIKDRYRISQNELYKQGQDLKWYPEANEGMHRNLKHLKEETRLRNAYLIADNKIMPEEHAIYNIELPKFSKRDIAWINSVFNGKDYDAAYKKARELALNNNSKHALMLCTYILSNVPGHVDTEILMARIYGWQQHFGKASVILEGTLEKYPNYANGYAALLDVYYWSNNDEKAMEVARLAEANGIRAKEVQDRIERARNIVLGKKQKRAVSVLPEKVRR